MTKIIDFIGDYIGFVVNWEYRDRYNAEKYMRQAKKIFQDLNDNDQTIFNTSFFKSYNKEFNELIKKMG